MKTPPPTMTVSPVMHSEGASAAPSEASPQDGIARAKPALELWSLPSASRDGLASAHLSTYPQLSTI